MEKHERHEVYKTMLSVYKKMVADERFFGFCATLLADTSLSVSRVTEEEEALLSPVELEELPELLAYKPEKDFYDCFGGKSDDSGQFWFPISNTEIRIKILEECIEKTK